MHQYHINGTYPIPRDETSEIPPSNATMINLASSVVPMEVFLENFQQSSVREKDKNKNKFNNMLNFSQIIILNALTTNCQDIAPHITCQFKLTIYQ